MKVWRLVILKHEGGIIETHNYRFEHVVANAGASWAHYTNDIVMLVEEDE